MAKIETTFTPGTCEPGLDTIKAPLLDAIQELEKELNHNDRYRLCGIKYEPIISEPVRISPTLEKIIQRLDERSQTAYNGYLNESDSLLDELEYKTQYEIEFRNRCKCILDSNETVFDSLGNLVRARNLKPNDQIRIYPRELADNLLQIAVDSEPEIYGKVLEHSEYWLNVLEKLDRSFNNRELLYRKLKEGGLKVQSNTVDAYFKGHRKYPMYNSDLRAILVLGERMTMRRCLRHRAIASLIIWTAAQITSPTRPPSM